jgi:hypothetical protein
MRFQVLTAANLKITAFWDIASTSTRLYGATSQKAATFNAAEAYTG